MEIYINNLCLINQLLSELLQQLDNMDRKTEKQLRKTKITQPELEAIGSLSTQTKKTIRELRSSIRKNIYEASNE